MTAKRNAPRQSFRTDRYRKVPLVLATLLMIVLLTLLWRKQQPDRAEPPPGASVQNVVDLPPVEGAAFQPGATVEQLKDEAIRTVDQLVDAFPDRAVAWTVAARLHQRLGQETEAIRFWEKALEVDPSLDEALFQLGVVARRQGDYATAEKRLASVPEGSPFRREAVALLGEVLLQQGRMGEAVEILEREVREPPFLDKSLLALGQAYMQQKQHGKAKATFERLVEVNPQEPAAYYGLGRIAALEGRAEEAKKFLEQFREVGAVNQGELARAARSYEDLATVRRLLGDTLSRSAQVWMDAGRPEEAELAWRKAAVIQPQDRACRESLLMLYDHQGRYREALAVCRQLCRIAPDHGDYWLNAGVLHGRLGELDQARSSLERALQLDPQNSRYRAAYDLVKGSR